MSIPLEKNQLMLLSNTIPTLERAEEKLTEAKAKRAKAERAKAEQAAAEQAAERQVLLQQGD
jgi:hypothetical protein